MNELLQYVFGYGYLGSLYLGAAVGSLVWVAVGMVYPRLLVLPLLLVLAAFPASSLLIAEGGLGFDVYGKGSGYLFFSLFEITIIAAALCIAMRSWFARAGQTAAWRVTPGTPLPTVPGNTLALYYWLMALLVAGHALNSLLTPREPWMAQLGRAGVTYLLLQGLFIVALVGAIDSRRALRQTMLAVGAVVALRMVWGALRYVALGGDPSSFYESGGSTLKITFWDINDSIWAVLLASALIWLAATKERWSPLARGAAFGLALLCFAIVALSARRTAQGGAVLGLLVLAWLLPRGRRWWVVVLFAATLPLAAYKLQARSDDNRSWFQKIFNAEQKGLYELDPRRQRFYELKMAMQTVAKNPIVGVGPAGEFNPPSHIGLEYHRGNYNFVHSGFVHVLLKTGVVGLAIFCGLLLAYGAALRRQWRDAPERYRVYLVASACSFAAAFPNLVFGTPMIESRTMFLMGLGFALPLLVARAIYAEGRAPVVGSRVPRRRFVLGWAR
ncbi:MAG: O-antigen ligase family protein [Bacteroidia bacterium]|jgi:hypothetical protein